MILISSPNEGTYLIEVEGLEHGEYDLYAGHVREGELIASLGEVGKEAQLGIKESFELEVRTEESRLWVLLEASIVIVLALVILGSIWRRRRLKPLKRSQRNLGR